jgi:soluble lytic murein transglycosylase-like protein
MLVALLVSLALAGKTEQVCRHAVPTVVQACKQIYTISKRPDSLMLAQAFVRVSVKYNLKPQRLIAIAALESMFDVSAYNAKTADYGIMQVNEYNVKAMKLDKARLLHDVEYSIDAGAQVLKYMRHRFAKVEPQTWVCRYNVGVRKQLTPFQVAKCEQYMSLYAGYAKDVP